MKKLHMQRLRKRENKNCMCWELQIIKCNEGLELTGVEEPVGERRSEVIA